MKQGFLVGLAAGLALSFITIAYGVGRYHGSAEKPDYEIKVLNQAMFLYLNNRTGNAYLCRVDGECTSKFKTN